MGRPLPRTHAIIQGGGVAAFSMAVALRRHGLRSHVVDLSHSGKHGRDLSVAPSPTLYLCPPATKILRLWNAIPQNSITLDSFSLRDISSENGGVYGEVSLRSLSSEPTDFIVTRTKDLIDTLQQIATSGEESSAQFSEVTRVVRGTTLSKISRRFEDDTRTFDCTLSSSSLQRLPPSDIVIGADGLGSRVREFGILGDGSRMSQEGHEFQARFCGYGVFQGTFHRDLLPNVASAVGTGMIEGWGNGRRVCLYPAPDNMIYFYAAATLPRPVPIGVRKDWISYLDRYFSDVKVAHFDSIIRILRQSSPNDHSGISLSFACPGYLPLQDPITRQTAKWANDGVVLIGDAAHAGNPLFWQYPGACLAIEDADRLAFLVAKTVRTEESSTPQGSLSKSHVDEAINRYVRERQARASALHSETLKLARSVHNMVPNWRERLKYPALKLLGMKLSNRFRALSNVDIHSE